MSYVAMYFISVIGFDPILPSASAPEVGLFCPEFGILNETFRTAIESGEKYKLYGYN